MLVQCAAVWKVVFSPGAVEDGVPVKRPSRVVVEQLKNFDVPGTQFRYVITTFRAEFSWYDRQIAHREIRWNVWFRCTASARNSSNPCDDLLDAEGLGDEIVSTDIEPDKTINFFSFCTDEDDRNVR